MNFEGCNAEIQGADCGVVMVPLAWLGSQQNSSQAHHVRVYTDVYIYIYDIMIWNDFNNMSTFFAALCCQVAGRKMVATWVSLTVLQRRQQVVHLGLDLAKRRCRNFQLFGKFLDHRSGWGVTGKIWNRLQQISWNLRHILELEPT